jgi:hypothetical protein
VILGIAIAFSKRKSEGFGADEEIPTSGGDPLPEQAATAVGT